MKDAKRPSKRRRWLTSWSTTLVAHPPVTFETFTGDSSRSIPPHFINGESAYFLANNRNKSSIALDLKKPEGLAIALDLISRVDVVIENYRPGVSGRLGLDIAKIREEHPRLIWASISGFGQEGEGTRRPAYDMIVQALAGAMSLTGEAGRPPVRLGIPAGDLVAGLYAAIGILAAVRDQIEHARGRTLDISMLDGMLAMISYQATYSLLTGVAPQPQGSRHDSIPTYRAYRGGDGKQFVVTANTERMWRDMCVVIGRPELVRGQPLQGAGDPPGEPSAPKSDPREPFRRTTSCGLGGSAHRSRGARRTDP